MKILHLSSSDSSGGAARAAYRIHQALLGSEISSSMRVVTKATNDSTVSNWYRKTLILTIRYEFYRRWLLKIKRSWKHSNKDLHSIGKYSIGIVDEINKSDADIVHLHWISDMLSIEDIGRIKKPIVWTMHDMWAFSGAEHYAIEGEHARFIDGYTNTNRPAGEKGPDMNKITWDLKMKHWSHLNLTIVGTTFWLKYCVSKSKLFSRLPVHVIPYPLETSYPWVPIRADVAKEALNLPQNCKLILMGADGGITNPRKGGDLLKEAVRKFSSNYKGHFEVMIFGQGSPGADAEWVCPVHWLGAVKDDRILALAYSAADIMIVPSRQEAFGQTASEAMACGTPVVSFNIGGLPDVVTHKENGWLASPFDTDDMAAGIEWIISDETRLSELSAKAVKSVVDRFEPGLIASAYHKVYSAILNKE